MTDTASLRLSEKNSLRLRIKELEVINKKKSEDIDRWSEKKDSFYTKKSEQYEDDIEKNEEEISRLTTRLSDVSEGKLDEELRKTILRTTKEANSKFGKKTEGKSSKNMFKARKKDIKAGAEQPNFNKKKKNQQQYKKPDWEARKYEYKRKGEKPSEEDMSKAYDRYLKIVSELPPRKKQLLEKMENNRGFIFKDVVFYGKKPALRKRNNRDPDSVLTETQKVGSEIITIEHRIFSNRIESYQLLRDKKGNKLPKKLLETVNRRKIPEGNQKIEKLEMNEVSFPSLS